MFPYSTRKQYFRACFINSLRKISVFFLSENKTLTSVDLISFNYQRVLISIFQSYLNKCILCSSLYDTSLRIPPRSLFLEDFSVMEKMCRNHLSSGNQPSGLTRTSFRRTRSTREFSNPSSGRGGKS